jgi:hypothetical protein
MYCKVEYAQSFFEGEELNFWANKYFEALSRRSYYVFVTKGSSSLAITTALMHGLRKPCINIYLYKNLEENHHDTSHFLSLIDKFLSHHCIFDLKTLPLIFVDDFIGTGDTVEGVTYDIELLNNIIKNEKGMYKDLPQLKLNTVLTHRIAGYVDEDAKENIIDRLKKLNINNIIFLKE